MDLTATQWKVLEPLLQEYKREDGRGRPWRDSREVLNGILDSAHWGSVAGFAQALSSVSNLSSTFSAVAKKIV
jgi:transposase